MKPVVRLEGTSRRYGSGRTAVQALHPVDLEVHAGEFVAVMGPSGSGKSTLLALAGGLDVPTSGRVEVLGGDLATMSRSELARLRRRTIGYVFQEFNLVAGLTAAENVSLPLELDGMPANQARVEALDALRVVDIGGLADRYPDDLSAGEQQRVAIARGVVGPRSLVLADEPTGALDSVTSEAIMRLLSTRCQSGVTVVLVTHDATHAAWADRVVFLRDGRVVDETGPLAGGAGRFVVEDQ